MKRTSPLRRSASGPVARRSYFVNGVLLLAACSPEQPTSVPFTEFWAAFRAAVLSADCKQIEAMTDFPFQTRGTLDGSAIVEHDLGGFRRIWPDLLAQDVGLGKEPETMRRFIDRIGPAMVEQSDDGTGSARAGNFLFRLVDGRWRFVRAYTDG